MSNKNRKNIDKLLQGINDVHLTLVGSGKAGFEIDCSLEVDFDSHMDDIRRIALTKLAIALPKVESSLAAALDAAMSASSWKWNTGSRDIIDTGALKNSLKIDWNGMRAIVRYDEPYAALIHEGGYIHPYGNKNASPVYLPGRPWVRSVLVGGGPVPEFDWRQAILQAL